MLMDAVITLVGRCLRITFVWYEHRLAATMQVVCLKPASIAIPRSGGLILTWIRHGFWP